MAAGSKNKGRYSSKSEYVDERRVRMKKDGGRILYVVLDKETNAKLEKIMDVHKLLSSAAAIRYLVRREHGSLVGVP